MKVLTYPDPLLERQSIDVAEFDEDLNDLIHEMMQCLKINNALGLAAPQLGVMKRVFVMDLNCAGMFGIFKPKAFINPRIMYKSNAVKTAFEGCLSVPGKLVPVIRSTAILVNHVQREPNGVLKVQEGAYHALQARIFQHETDHLDGKVIGIEDKKDTL